MPLSIIALFLATPTLDIDPETGQPGEIVEDDRAVANVLDLRIRALSEAVNGDDAQAIESAATALLATTNILVEPLAEQGEADALAALHALRGWSLWSLDRIEEADAAFDLAGPENAREFGYLAFRHDLAWEQRDWPKILDILETDVAVAEPQTAIVHVYNDEGLDILRRRLGFGEANGRVAEVLIRANWGAGLPPGERDWVYLFAMKARHDAGDESGAREALSMMRNPTYIVDILLDSDLAEYHAQIEDQHGVDLGRAAIAISTDLAALWEQRNGDAEYLLNYLISLRGRGRWEEIADQFGPIADGLQRSLANGDTDHFLVNAEGFFVVNYLADAELRLDRYATAIGRMNAILELGLEDHPDLINQAINRLEMPLQIGDYSETLRAAIMLEEVAGSIVAPYGRMLIRSGAACAAHLLGDAETASDWRERLLTMENPSSIVVLETYLCLDDLEAAERHVLEGLQGDSTYSLRFYFQERTLWEPRGDYDRMIKERANALRARPAVRAAIDAAGGVRRFALAHLSA